MPERIDIRRLVRRAEVESYADAFLDHLRRYYFAVDIISGRCQCGQVLDIPCGLGYGSAIIANSLTGIQVVGVDIDREAVQDAQALFRSYGALFIHGDMVCLQRVLVSSYDVAVSFEGLEHVADSEQAVQQMHAVLRDGGLLIASIPREAAGNEWHKRWFPTEQSIRDLFEPVFGAGHYTVGTQLDGTYHRGEIDASLVEDRVKGEPFSYWIVLATRVGKP